MHSRRPMSRSLLPFVVFLALAPMAGSTALAQSRPTARQIVDRIKLNVGVPWNEKGVDTFKDGDPDTPVTGVAVTMMATLDVLQRAAAAGANFVITHEPVFYTHHDSTVALEKEHDPVLAAKRDFIRAHHMVVWRFHDHWHARRPDQIQLGMEKALGWSRYRTPANDSLGTGQPATDYLFELPETTLGSLASELGSRLGARAVRVVGDPRMKVSKVAFIGGFPGFAPQRGLLRRDDVEVLVMGEAHEWETISYAADAIAAGERKALIVLGHNASEQGGMEECARWLKGFVADVPVRFIAAADPFQSIR